MHIEPLAASSYALGISNSFKKINVQELYSMVDVFCHLYPRNDDSLDLGGAERWRKVRTSQGVVVRRDAGDYGGNFSTYTPPTGEEALIIIAEDTNAGSPGRRIYVYSGGAWRYANLS